MEFEDILYKKEKGVAKIIINRPQRMNSFRMQTLDEIAEALQDAWMDKEIGVVVLTGTGDRAFCAGGDVKERAETGTYGTRRTVFNVHQLIRDIPKPVIAAVNGFAIGGGHVLHVVCDLSIASETARFGQVGPRVGSVDPGFGTAYLARLVGEKKAREIWYLCRQYSAQEALEMGLVNKVVPPDKLEEEVDAWCQEILAMSPTAIRIAKSSFNCDTDHMYGLENLGRIGLMLYYMTDEAREGAMAWAEKRPVDFARYRYMASF